MVGRRIHLGENVREDADALGHARGAACGQGACAARVVYLRYMRVEDGR